MRYTKDWKYVLLAVDIPPLNVQTPKAVEQLFTHIFSVMEPPSIGYKFRRGFQQYSFSFEIVSIEGYIQFLIRTLDKYRDVVEAAVYAQYPEAEITEVEDYTADIPSNYPNDTHNVWAADFLLTQHFSQPIRMYQEFEHSISKDTVLKDPMGTFLESFSRIGPGEQMWYQLLIEPVEEKKWKPECIKKIKEMIGEKAKGGGSKIADTLTTVPIKTLEMLGDEIFGREASSGGDKGGGEPPNTILYMTPGQKKLLEAMEAKISKIGFKTMIRAIYVARKEVFNPSRGVNSLVGAMNQFNDPSSNSLLPKYLTSAQYLHAAKRKDRRRTILMKAYKDRNMYAAKDPYVLNVEELATIWHFPMSHVKTPMVQKAQGKRSEPPAGLPVEPFVSPQELPSSDQKALPPHKTPYYTDSGDVGYGDNEVKLG